MLPLRFCISLLIIFLLGSISAGAQYLEFVQNKGQWPEEVLFKTQLNGSAIFLTRQGYKTTLHNPEDLALANFVAGGHEHEKKGKGSPIYEENLAARAAVLAPSLPPVIRSHAWEVVFVGGNSRSVVRGEKKLLKKMGYFQGSDSSRWAGDCQVFQTVEYKDFYPNIDLRYYTQNHQVKYDLVVRPGGKVSDIQLRYDGVNGLGVDKTGKLQISTSLGMAEESRPLTYAIGNQGRVPVNNRYVVIGNTVRFSPDAYDLSNTLIIDPVFIFAAYTGSTADNWGYTATFDGNGNMYGGGIAFSSGYPIRNGPVNNGFGGGESEGQLSGYDIALTKWNPLGTQQLYSLYMGGTANEQPHSMVADGAGRLTIAGRTSSPNFPATQPVYGQGGAADIVIFTISSSGNTVVASRKFGGTGEDGVNVRAKYLAPTGAESTRRNYGDDARSEVLLDPNGDILLATNTRSSNFPTTSNAIQTTLSGPQDGVFLRVNPNMNVVLNSTLFGGTGIDANFVLRRHPTTREIYIGGSTNSSVLPGTFLLPVINATYQGGETDGYVYRMNPDATALINTTFIGTSSIDMLYGLDMDKSGNLYVMGVTFGTWPVINAAFQQPNGRQYIVKMNASLSTVAYSTSFGKGAAAPDISPIAFLVDRCENVYVSGWGGSINTSQGYPNSGTNGMTILNSVTPITGDGNDFYLFVMERNATRQLYGGLFGATGGLGDHVDGGTSRFDAQGAIYHAVCSCTGPNQGGGTPFPVSAGVESPTNNSNSCNLAVFKILLDYSGVGAGVRASIDGQIRDTSGCLPLKVDFQDTLQLGVTYRWNFGDGSPDTTTTTPNVSHVYNTVGTYQVRLVSVDSSTCNITDTSYTQIRVRSDEVTPLINPVKQLPCDSLLYTFFNVSRNPSGKPYRNTSFTWDFGDGTSTVTTDGRPVNHRYAAAGTYTVRLTLNDTNFCNAPAFSDTIIRISTVVDAQFKAPGSGCVPLTVNFENESRGGVSFQWFFGDGGTSTDVSPRYTYNSSGTFQVTLIAIDSNTCNITDTVTRSIVISSSPIARFSISPNPPQTNTPVQFTNTTLGQARLYRWVFGDGDTLTTTRRDTVITHQYQKTGTYKACLRATNQFGCFSDTCTSFNLTIIPLLDVPNAFTPNGDGNNDRIFVRGFGIAKMNWRIYNRWGQLVFQSNSAGMGWDGIFNGKRQPIEVYAYTLDVTFSDGTSFQKKGDISLIR